MVVTTMQSGAGGQAVWVESGGGKGEAQGGWMVRVDEWVCGWQEGDLADFVFVRDLTFVSVFVVGVL